MVLGYLNPDLNRCPWMRTALLQWGVSDIPGLRARISSYLASVGDPLTDSDTHQTTNWCSAFVNSCMEKSGIHGTGHDNARSWLGWGVPLALPEWGCVTVFWRKAPHTHWGHVGFFLGYSQHGDILLLGGNQTLNPQVCVGEYPRSRLLGFRWPAGTLTEATV
jgi:uncharacterized protein (TIGR02594 family)